MTNKNIGRSAANNAGLILQAKPKVTKNEAGLRQAALVFNLPNSMYQTLDPGRGTPCPSFVAGSPRTTALLANLDYLAAHTSEMDYDAIAPGIGQLQVLCQGAVFPTPLPDDPITPVFFSSTVVKDTQQFIVYSPVGSGTIFQALVCATPGMLPSSTFGTYYGYDGFRANAHGLLPPIDGVPVGRGDLILLPAYGVFVVLTPGGPARQWIISKVPDSEPSSDRAANVAAGDANNGFWDGSSGVYVSSGVPQNTPRYKVTVEYRALELSFEYVAQKYAQAPRYLQPGGYILSDDGTNPLDDSNVVVIDRTSGVGLALFRDQVAAIEQLATGLAPNVSVADGPEVGFGKGKKQFGEKFDLVGNFVTSWTSFVRLVGDNAQFVQSEAGAIWNVKETVTVKYAPLTPIGSVVALP